MNITLRTKLIILSTVLVAVIMGTVTYFFTIRELASKKAGVKSQIQRIAQNIATLQLLERQEWDVYQNYIDQLMPINKDIVYIAVYDDRNTLRAHTLNQELIVLESSVLTRRRRAKIIRQLERGAIAEESHGDLRTERVNIQAGDRVLGSVHVGFSLIDINEELQNGIRLNIGLALFFIVLFSGVSVLISRRLTKPLERLSKAMEAVNEGNLSQKVEPQTHDEIAQLTATFNEMIDGLQERLIIENLGYELSAIFRLERLVPLVRQRLKNAIGASNARLYIRDRRTKHLFHESTVSDEEKPLYPALHLSEEIKAYLWQHNKGFMIFSAPKSVIAALRHQHSQEDGLVIPMTVKDELFGLLFFALPPNQKQYSKKQMNFAATLARQAALALENALLYEDLREQERLKRELEIAREVQQKLLPRTMPEVDGFKFDGICQSAQEVGGDYFDFFHLDDHRLGVVIADVSGKGTSASFYMAEIKGMMLQLTTNFRSPKALLSKLNHKLFGNIDRRLFVTMVYGVINISTKQFTFSRAGHNPLLRIGRNGDFEFLTPAGIGLGLDSGAVFDVRLEEVTLNLGKNEILLLYTDGVTEARNSQQLEFGEDRLLKSLKAQQSEDIVQIRKSLLQSLQDFMGDTQPHDDITMVMLKCFK